MEENDGEDSFYIDDDGGESDDELCLDEKEKDFQVFL